MTTLRNIVLLSALLTVESALMPPGATHLDALKTLEQLQAFVARAEEQRVSLGYEIDGVVIKVNSTAVQKRLGHSNIAITLDIYSHVVPAMQSDVVDRIKMICNEFELYGCRRGARLTSPGRGGNNKRFRPLAR